MKEQDSDADEKSSIDKRIKILKSVNIFQESTPEILNHLAESLEEFEIEENEVVFHKGDLLHAMYIIVHGSVKVHDGDYEFTRFNKNEYFGEYSLIDSSVRSASVTALERTKLLRLDKKVFDEILDKDIHIAKAVLRTLIHRLRENNILEERLTQRSHELKLKKEEIEKKKRELEELNETKDKFFSIIAHDLKNPFNTVIGLSELLLYKYDSYDNDKIKEFIEQINQFSSNAYNLLDNLLQWARNQTGKLKVKPSEIELEKLIQENILMEQDRAEQKNIELKQNIPGGMIAYADPNMVNTVVRNLISNAIKFTPQNGKITLKAEETDDNYIKCSVIDTGVGIPEKDRDKLFKNISNFTTEGTQSEKGTGLGLILCKEFVEKNKGEIWVESEEGKGSAFIFTLPKPASD